MADAPATTVDHLGLSPPLDFNAQEVPRSYEHTILGSANTISIEEFEPKIRKCLDLLKTSPASYNFCVSYNLSIRAATRSGANFGDSTIDIARQTFDASITWLTSVLVHETVHFWQLKNGHYKAGQQAESEANFYQLRFLESIKAPSHELEYMRSQDGNHAGKDGSYTWDDYYARNY